MVSGGVGPYTVIINGAECYGNGWPLSKMNQVQTVAGATDTIRLGIDEVRVDYSSTGAVTDLEYPDALLPYRVKNLLIYDSGGKAGTNNITIKDSDNAVIAVIATDYGSVMLSSDGTNIDVVSIT